jgi:protocatechuate 3,4-dioxygenase beta subunit
MRLMKWLLILTVLSQVGFAQQKQDTKGTIEGIVIDSVTSAPIKDAEISLIAEQHDRESPQGISTDEKGRFELAGIAPGQYRLFARARTYVDQNGGQAADRHGMLLTLAPHQHLTGLTVALEPSAVIYGHVLDEKGKPLAHCVVQTFPHSGKGSTRPAPQSAQTDDRGEYRIYDLPPREYDIVAACTAEILRVSGSGDKEEKERKRYVPTFYPNAIERDQALPLKLRGGDELAADITIMKAKAVHVRGVVVGGSSSAVMMAQLSPRSGILLDSPSTVVHDGTFDFPNVVPGSYGIQVSAQDMEASQARSGREKIDVGPEGLDGVKVTLASSMKVTGLIRSASFSPIRYSDFFVVLMPGSLESLMDNGTFSGVGGMSPVKENGDFEIDGVVPGEYQLLVGSNSSKYGNWYTRTVQLEGRDVTDEGLHLASGIRAATVDVVLSANGASIEGVVLDEHDHPVAGAPVQAIPSVSKRNRIDQYGSSETDQNGRFEMSGLAPGEYSVVAGDMDREDRLDLEIVNRMAKLGTTVQLDEYSRETIQVRLKSSKSE